MDAALPPWQPQPRGARTSSAYRAVLLAALLVAIALLAREVLSLAIAVFATVILAIPIAAAAGWPERKFRVPRARARRPS